MNTEFLTNLDKIELNATNSIDESNSTSEDKFWLRNKDRILHIEVQQALGYDEVRNTNFNWTVVEYARRTLLLQLSFEKAIEVS